MIPTKVGVAEWLRRSSGTPGVRKAAPRLLATEWPVLLPDPELLPGGCRGCSCCAQGARYTNLPACTSACICSSKLQKQYGREAWQVWGRAG